MKYMGFGLWDFKLLGLWNHPLTASLNAAALEPGKTMERLWVFPWESMVMKI